MPLKFQKNISVSKKAYIKKLLAALAVLSLYIVFVSLIIGHGQIDFFHREALGEVFVDTWHNLMRWEFDVNYSSIGAEAFYRNGKVYTYFGPFPAFIRGGMEILFGRVQTDWSRISFLMAAAIFPISSYFVFKNVLDIFGVRSFFYSWLLTGSTVLSSPYTFLFSSAVGYHEVIIWALAWSMTGLALITHCYRKKNFNLFFLLLISLCAGFAFLSRTLTSLGIFLIMSIVFAIELFKEKLSASRYKKVIPQDIASVTYTGRRRFIAIGMLPVLISIGFMLTVNYYRWGSPLEFFPAKYHNRFRSSPERLEYFNGIKPYSLERAKQAIHYYFMPSKSNFTDSFPYIRFLPKKRLGYGPSTYYKDPSLQFYDYDHIEPGAPVTLFSPLLFIFSGIGLFAFFRHRFPCFIYLIVAPLFAPAFFIIFWPGLTIRYSAEFLPLLVLLSAIGAAMVAKSTSKIINNWLLRAFFIFVLFAGMFMAFNVIYKYKLFTWYVPDFYKYLLISMFQ